jgi:hypothetical protein
MRLLIECVKKTGVLNVSEKIIERGTANESGRLPSINFLQQRDGGAEDGTRTRYLQLGKLSLYLVSYFRKGCLAIPVRSLNL